MIKLPRPGSVASAIERLLNVPQIRGLLSVSVFCLPFIGYYAAVGSAPSTQFEFGVTALLGLVLLTIFYLGRR